MHIRTEVRMGMGTHAHTYRCAARFLWHTCLRPLIFSHHAYAHTHTHTHTQIQATVQLNLSGMHVCVP